MGKLIRWRCMGCGALLLGRAIDNPLLLKHRRPVNPGRVPTLCREDGLMQLVEYEAEAYVGSKNARVRRDRGRDRGRVLLRKT